MAEIPVTTTTSSTELMTSTTNPDDVYTGSGDEEHSFWGYDYRGLPFPPWVWAAVAAGVLPLLVCLTGLALHAVNM